VTNRNAASMGTYGSTWEAAGYSGGGLVGDLVGTLQDRPAIVCGNADGVFDEARFALIKYPNAVVFGVNDIGMYLDRLDHWVSLHTDNLGAWKAVRWLHPHAAEKTQYHAIDRRSFIDHVWTGLTPLFAVSGYFAMQIAHIMGASLIILCGCPGNRTRRFFEAEARADFEYGAGSAGSDKGVREQLIHEMQRLPDFKIKVRSLSGWTRDFFGSL